MIRTLLALLLISLATEQATAQIVVDNHEDRSTVRYPVILLRGKVSANSKDLQIQLGDRTSRVVRHENRFKALVQLDEGENVIHLQTTKAGKPLKLQINYRPQTNAHYVRIIWLTDSSGDTQYATPDKDDPQDYESRLQTAATLMQTFAAEKMHDIGLPRSTFRLERDKDGVPIVHTIKGEREAAYYHRLNDQKWWREIHGWLHVEHSDPLAKNMVLAAYTRKDADTGEMLAHTALGGGNLGLFGSASIFSWPRNLEEAITVFSDDSEFDSSAVHNDSAFRNRIWALASTTIGATLHEMGHTFDLPHCTDRLGIMTRGFDHFSRAFTFHDPKSHRRTTANHFAADQEAYFSPVSATYLQLSPWFQADGPADPDRAPTISIDEKSGRLTIECKSGVAWVGFYVGGDIHAFNAYAGKRRRKKVVFSKKEISTFLKGKPLSKVQAVSPAGSKSDKRLSK